MLPSFQIEKFSRSLSLLGGDRGYVTFCCWILYTQGSGAGVRPGRSLGRAKERLMQAGWVTGEMQRKEAASRAGKPTNINSGMRPGGRSETWLGEPWD